MKTQRWRITFSKTEAMRYTGHLDLILTWERTFRRSGLPLSYSEGFNPRPVINLAAPLPLGLTSTGEIGDFWLSETLSEEIFRSSLSEALPPGIKIQKVDEIADLYGNKLPSLVEAALYRLEIKQRYPGISQKISELLESETLIRERKGKQYDLRPLIKDLVQLVPSEPDSTMLETTLSLLPGATGRPDEVLRSLDVPPGEAWISRQRILLKDYPPT